MHDTSHYSRLYINQEYPFFLPIRIKLNKNEKTRKKNPESKKEKGESMNWIERKTYQYRRGNVFTSYEGIKVMKMCK